MEFGYRLKHLFDMPPYYQIWPILLKRTRLPYFPKKCDVATRQWFHDGLIISFRYPPNCHFLFVTLSGHEMRIDGRRFRVLGKNEPILFDFHNICTSLRSTCHSSNNTQRNNANFIKANIMNTISKALENWQAIIVTTIGNAKINVW